MFVTIRYRAVQHRLIHLDRDFFIGPGLQTAADVFSQRRSLMYLQEIKRQVLGSQGKSLVEISLPTRETLPRQAGNQIEADVIKAGRAQMVKRAPRVVRRVGTAESREFTVVKRLGAKARAVYPERPKGRKRFRSHR